jgi:hypothetical protein
MSAANPKLKDSPNVPSRSTTTDWTGEMLRKSLNLGRVATPKDMEPDLADQGVENHILRAASM